MAQIGIHLEQNHTVIVEPVHFLTGGEPFAWVVLQEDGVTLFVSSRDDGIQRARAIAGAIIAACNAVEAAERDVAEEQYRAERAAFIREALHIPQMAVVPIESLAPSVEFSGSVTTNLPPNTAWLT